MGVTEKFARFVVETKSSDIPDAAVDVAATSLMDAMGTALAGRSHQIGEIITRYIAELGGTPTSRVIGTAIKTSAPNAALANGTLGHADDYDDVGCFGHPSVTLMPTVLALGEQLHKSGREVLEAYVLGFEVGARISANLGADHYERGWHSTVTIGTMAAAAAASRLLGLDIMQTRMSLGIAASHAAGVQANFGTMTKPLHPGNGARSGIMAAQLAKMGYTANPNVIEAPLGYVAVFGDELANINGMATQLGLAPYYIVSPGVHIKEWPCCYGNHAAIPLTVGLVSKHEIRPEQVESVEFVGAGALGYLNRPSVETPFGGKFSLQYNIAAAIVDGEITYETFGEEKVKDPAIQAVMKKVTLREDPKRAKLPARVARADQSQTITIHLRDGRVASDTLQETTNTLRGHQVDVKFEANARRTLSATQAKRALGVLHNFKNLADVTEAMDAVTLE